MVSGEICQESFGSHPKQPNDHRRSNRETVPVENLINGRPFIYTSDNVSAPEFLIPNRLLVGGANPNMPPDVFDGCDMKSKKR